MIIISNSYDCPSCIKKTKDIKYMSLNDFLNKSHSDGIELSDSNIFVDVDAINVLSENTAKDVYTCINTYIENGINITYYSYNDNMLLDGEPINNIEHDIELTEVETPIEQENKKEQESEKYNLYKIETLTNNEKYLYTCIAKTNTEAINLVNNQIVLEAIRIVSVEPLNSTILAITKLD